MTLTLDDIVTKVDALGVKLDELKQRDASLETALTEALAKLEAGAPDQAKIDAIGAKLDAFLA